MNVIRTVIVEDEPLAQERLRQCLEDEPDIEIVKVCATGTEAADAIRTLDPDLVFLDVQIPEMNGFAVLRESRRDEDRPVVVFVTAYEQYALEGFEVNALDYLLKPFDEDRFQETMRRVRAEFAAGPTVEVPREMLDAFREMRGTNARAREPEPPLQRITVRESGRVYFLRCEDIGWIEAAGNYARAHVGNKSHLVRISLKELERKLPADTFVRVHRGIIVNLEHVEEIQPYMHGDYHVHLRGGTVVRMSRRYRAAVLS